MSPNPVWLWGSRRPRPVRVDDGQAGDGVVAEHEGDVDDQVQATAQRREDRVGAEVAVALRASVEPLSEREEPQPVKVAVLGVDPALPGRAARTVGRRHPGFVPTLAEERRERQRPPGVRIGLAEDRLGDRVEEPRHDPGRRRCRAVGGVVRGPGDGHRRGHRLRRRHAVDDLGDTARLAIPAGGKGGDGFCAGRHPRTSGNRRRVRPRTGRLGGGESGILPLVYSLSIGFRAPPQFNAGARKSANARHPSPWGRNDPTRLLSLRPEDTCDLVRFCSRRRNHDFQLECGMTRASYSKACRFHGTLAATQVEPTISGEYKANPTSAARVVCSAVSTGSLSAWRCVRIPRRRRPDAQDMPRT